LCEKCARKHGGLCIWCLEAVPDEKRWALSLIKLVIGLSIVLGFLIPAPMPLLFLVQSNPVLWGFGFLYGFIFLILFTILYHVVKERAIKAVKIHASRDARALQHPPVEPSGKREPAPAITPSPPQPFQALFGPSSMPDNNKVDLQIPEIQPVVEKPANAAPETGIEFIPMDDNLANEETITELPGKGTRDMDLELMDVDEQPGENEPVDGIRLRKIEKGELQAELNQNSQDNLVIPISDDSTREPQLETMKQEDEQSKQDSIAWLEKQLMIDIDENNSAPEPPAIEKAPEFIGTNEHDLGESPIAANEDAMEGFTGNKSPRDVPIVPAQADASLTNAPELEDNRQLYFTSLDRSLPSIDVEKKEQPTNFFCLNCRNHFQGTPNRINICPFCGYPVKS